MWGRSQEGTECTCQLGHLHEASGVGVSAEDGLQQQQEALSDCVMLISLSAVTQPTIGSAYNMQETAR